MLKDFKAFLLRGNVVDLAVAVVIGSAFTGLVNALVSDLITPLVAAIGGKPDFSALSFTINGSTFTYGNFLNAIISFVIMAAVMFFLVVHPMNMFLKRTRLLKDAENDIKDPQLQVLEEIRDNLKRRK